MTDRFELDPLVETSKEFLRPIRGFRDVGERLHDAMLRLLDERNEAVRTVLGLPDPADPLLTRADDPCPEYEEGYRNGLNRAVELFWDTDGVWNRKEKYDGE